MSSETEPNKKKPMPWVKSPDGVIDIYANEAHITWTLDDVRVRLAQVIDSPETPNPGDAFLGVIEERAAVTFSWRTAKLLRDGLSRIIAGYEAINGEIKTNPTLAQPKTES
jgi:hypothetical protein